MQGLNNFRPMCELGLRGCCTCSPVPLSDQTRKARLALYQGTNNKLSFVFCLSKELMLEPSLKTSGILSHLRIFSWNNISEFCSRMKVRHSDEIVDIFNEKAHQLKIMHGDTQQEQSTTAVLWNICSRTLSSWEAQNSVKFNRIGKTLKV